MGWLLVLVLLLIAGFAVPRLGKALLVVCGVLILLIIGLFAYLSIERRRSDAEDVAASKRIPHADVELSDLVLEPSGSGSYKLTGRVHNGSGQYLLYRLHLKLTLHDCVKPDSCEIIGQAGADADNLVPPGQTRAIDEYVFFSAIPQVRGKFTWTYELVSVSGR